MNTTSASSNVVSSANVQQDVSIRNIRLIPRLTDDGVVGDVVGDLWIVFKNGTTMIASGKMKFLYDVCNRESFNLLNYNETLSNTKTQDEYRDWQRKNLMAKKRRNNEVSGINQ